MGKDNYKAWEINAKDFPENGSFEDKIKFILRYAILAPSTLNTQPWYFSFENDQVLIYADFSKKLEQSDPTGRELFISLGACIFNFIVAASNFSYQSKIEYFSRPEKENLIASIRLSKASVNNDLSKYFPALTKRCSNRGVFTRKKTKNQEIATYNLFNTNKIRVVEVDDDLTINKIAHIVQKADLETLSKKSVRKEFSQWVRTNITQLYDGMPGFGLGFKLIPSLLLPFLIRVKDVSKIQAKKDSNLINSSSKLIVIFSEDNDKLNWVKVGEIYERILLDSTLNGLSNSTMTVLIENKKSNEEIRALFKLKMYPQIFLRLGYSENTPNHSPRKRLEDVFI